MSTHKYKLTAHFWEMQRAEVTICSTCHGPLDVSAAGYACSLCNCWVHSLCAPKLVVCRLGYAARNAYARQFACSDCYAGEHGTYP